MKKQPIKNQPAKNQPAKKQFTRTLILFFILFVAALTTVNVLLDKVGGIRIFSGEENLLADMETIVDPDSPFFSKYKDSRRLNVLLVGINDGLTDTIMLGSYDMKNQRVDVISIPRDTFYHRDGYKSAAAQKINAIYQKGGAVGTAEAVSEILMGMPIHNYVVIEYDDVREIVDAIGGVPMVIPPKFKYDDPYDKPPLHINLPEGPRVLNGDEAVQFLRMRKAYPGGSDIERVKAQQEFVKSAFRESLGFGLPKVAKTVMETVDSDLTVGTAGKVALKASGLSAEGITTWMVPGEAHSDNGASYWYVDTEAVGEMIDQIYSDPKGPEETEDGEEPENAN